jgi:hypothetical protein
LRIGAQTRRGWCIKQGWKVLLKLCQARCNCVSNESFFADQGCVAVRMSDRSAICRGLSKSARPFWEAAASALVA